MRFLVTVLYGFLTIEDALHMRTYPSSTEVKSFIIEAVEDNTHFSEENLCQFNAMLINAIALEGTKLLMKQSQKSIPIYVPLSISVTKL